MTPLFLWVLGLLPCLPCLPCSEVKEVTLPRAPPGYPKAVERSLVGLSGIEAAPSAVQDAPATSPSSVSDPLSPPEDPSVTLCERNVFPPYAVPPNAKNVPVSPLRPDLLVPIRESTPRGFYSSTPQPLFGVAWHPLASFPSGAIRLSHWRRFPREIGASPPASPSLSSLCWPEEDPLVGHLPWKGTPS